METRESGCWLKSSIAPLGSRRNVTFPLLAFDCGEGEFESIQAEICFLFVVDLELFNFERENAHVLWLVTTSKFKLGVMKACASAIKRGRYPLQTCRLYYS